MSLTLNDVMKKVYGVELKKNKKSQRSEAGVDDVYKPHGWCFHLMKFLDHMQLQPSYSNGEEQIDSKEAGNVTSHLIPSFIQ